ncbi:DUF916 domain-containing protein [Planococcus shenhongbingii]|uniref:DUF916 domain-containing protein n=1 Tax=Planococcus shenhongbingii TaxID=3058398 RepID=UPI002639076D|nr:DUF916 domain-containing protein [Planococcus sp. N016]WKA58330.1 DUF916 domain-containing protein [Planococcus sp. N016]
MFKPILATLAFLFFVPTITLAAEPTSSLEVEPIYPENQVMETKGYFDVDVLPDEQVTMHLRLRNNEETPIDVRVEKANAYTSPTGGILYQLETESEGTTLLDDAVRLADHMETEEMVTIPALESVDLPVQVTVPDIDGQTLLGGIKIIQLTDTKEAEGEAGKDEATFTIDTETAHVFAIQLNLPTNAEPDFSTGKAGFTAPTAQVYLEVINDAHLIQGNIEWTYSVLDHTGTALFDGTVTTFNMAPKSKIRFPAAWNHEELKDGSYTLVANGQAGDQVIEVEEPFEISTEEVEEYAEVINPTAVVEGGDIPMWVWVSIAVAFGVIMFLLGQRRKKV